MIFTMRKIVFDNFCHGWELCGSGVAYVVQILGYLMRRIWGHGNYNNNGRRCGSPENFCCKWVVMKIWSQMDMIALNLLPR